MSYKLDSFGKVICICFIVDLIYFVKICGMQIAFIILQYIVCYVIMYTELRRNVNK